ncbi:hypothetical protein [Acetobacter tropicalis]|nr:hypothetical protein [Acetobacter tropicalis]
MVLLQAIKAQSTDMPIFKVLHIMFFGQTFLFFLITVIPSFFKNRMLLVVEEEGVFENVVYKTCFLSDFIIATPDANVAGHALCRRSDIIAYVQADKGVAR